MHHFIAQWDQIEINFQSGNGISIVLIHEICWCAKISSFQKVWKAKRWESKSCCQQSPSYYLAIRAHLYRAPLCYRSGIKSKSIFNQVKSMTNDKWQILGSRLFFLRFLQSFSKSTKSVSIIYFAPLCKVTDQIHYVFRGAAAEATHSGSKCIKFAWNMISPNFSKQLSAFPFLVNTWTAYSKLVTGIVWSVNWMMNQFYDKIDLFLAGFWLLVQLFGGAFAARRVKSGHH